ENPQCLCIYFGGVVEEKVDNIYSVVLETQDDLVNSEIFNSEFPNLKKVYNLNNFMQMNSFTNERTNQANEKKQSSFKVIDFTLPLKRPMFTITVTILFVLYNLFGVQGITNANTYLYDYAIYTPFITELHQFSRLLTGLFTNQGLLTVFIVAYYFFIYNTLVELKLGLKKTIILFVIGIIAILISMVFVSQGNIYLGSFPIMSLVTGAYIGTLMLPTEKKFAMLNIVSNLPMIVLYLLIVFLDPTSIVVNLIAISIGAMSVIALDTEKMPIRKPYLISVIVILILMVGTYFIPNQTLSRNTEYETKYIDYLKTTNTIKASEVSKELDKYYDNLGVINYDE
ncbi:MAG: rhomboid family intramembrane serine protease, partial [Bacilli bacterium]|nr:rhomboid family intramembrane serine protease [Bacilli bacterium]